MLVGCQMINQNDPSREQQYNEPGHFLTTETTVSLNALVCTAVVGPVSGQLRAGRFTGHGTMAEMAEDPQSECQFVCLHFVRVGNFFGVCHLVLRLGSFITSRNMKSFLFLL